MNDRSLSLGFFSCFILTIAAYVLVVSHVFSEPLTIGVIVGFAFIQFVVQLFVFLHLGQGSKWQRLMFIAMVFVVTVVVAGSIWIMHNLDYNMMNMSTTDKAKYMQDNEGL